MTLTRCYTCIITMDILLLRSYTRFSCSLIKWNLQWAKVTNFSHNPIPSPPNGWTKWPYLSNPNRPQFFLWNISTYILHPLSELFISDKSTYPNYIEASLIQKYGLNIFIQEVVHAFCVSSLRIYINLSVIVLSL